MNYCPSYLNLLSLHIGVSGIHSGQQDRCTCCDSFTFPLASIWLANFHYTLEMACMGRDFLKFLVGCCDLVFKKDNSIITIICSSGRPELPKGKSLDSIAFVSRKKSARKLWTDKQRKEFGLRKTGSGTLVHRGPNKGNEFERECVDLGLRKEKTAFACNSSTNVRTGQQKWWTRISFPGDP